MATGYPSAIDVFVDPTPTSDEAAVSHAGQHAGANDGLHAVQAALGTHPQGSFADVATRLAAAEAATAAQAVDAASAYVQKDGTGKTLASAMRPVNDRGLVAASTTYNPWDLIVYRNQRILITQTFTTTTGTPPFVSAANYVTLGPQMWFSVKDFGAKGDASTDDTVAIQKALDWAASQASSTGGGGTVFFPEGYYEISATLIIGKHVTVRGEGMIASVVRLMPAANCHIIQNRQSSGGTGNADFCGFMDMGFDGNYSQQTGGNGHGIYLTTNPLNSGASGDSYFDMHHTLSNVRVYHTAQDAFHFAGRSGISVNLCFAQNPQGYGFYSTFDTDFSRCLSDSSGLSGFYLNNGSIHIATSKSYLSGTVDGVGSGFEFGSNANGVSLAACEAQNNQGRGYYLNGCNRVNIQGIADSNNCAGPTAGGTGTFSGIELVNSDYNNIDLVCWQGVQGAGRIGDQNTALKIDTASLHNNITLTHSAGPGVGNTISTVLAAGNPTVDPTNMLLVNGAFLSPSVEVQSNKGLPNGYPPLNSSGQIASAYLPAATSQATFSNGFFGDGSDGTIVLDGTTAFPGFASLSAGRYSLIRDVFATTLTVNSGVVLDPKGFTVYASVALTGTGTITRSASAAISSAAGFGGVSTGYLGSGVNGGAGTTTAGGVGVTNANQCFGSNGGAGGTGASGAGGAGGTVTPAGVNTGIPNRPRRLPDAVTGAAMANGSVLVFGSGSGGGGGGGDGTNAGGGGGGSAGVLIICAKVITGTLTFSANGGAGFTPAVGNCGGGGGGSGGLVIVNTTASAGQTLQALAGAAGAGAGTGTTGTVGAVGQTFLNVWT